MVNKRILATEEMVGHGHGTKADTLNRQMMVEHLESGVHVAEMCRIKTGSYTGDGSIDQGITGVGFQPKFVKIWIKATGAGNQGWEKLDQGWTTYAYFIASNDYIDIDDAVISLDADGFSVDDAGTDEHPNHDTELYSYLALG